MAESMRRAEAFIAAEEFIAADWGTTNRRAYRIDAGGACIADFEDGKGVLSVPDGGFPDAVAEIRKRLGDLPLLLAGMVGSNRGWVEAPYVRCPAGIDDLAAALAWPDRRTAIVPGLAFTDGDVADVMRGEEVQLLGAVAAGLAPADALVCHPGTHNKWAEVTGGRVTGFRTVMTGELFNLLKAGGILSELLADPVEPGPAFDSGVRRGFDCAALAAELFAIRARVLLGRAERGDSADFASGLLIGNDVAFGLAGRRAGPVTVMGRPDLTALYARAIALAGAEPVELDGESCFLAGIRQIAERIA